MANNSDVASAEYHYTQQAKNRETVRTQGQAINTALKKLKRISSQKSPIPDSPTRDDEPTQQHVTITTSKLDLSLREALEDAEAQCRKSKAPPPEKANGAKKRKRWFGWAD